MKIRCDCGRTFSVPESAAGRRGKCSHCGASFLIPLPPEILRFAAGAKLAHASETTGHGDLPSDHVVDETVQFVEITPTEANAKVARRKSDRLVASKRPREDPKAARRIPLWIVGGVAGCLGLCCVVGGFSAAVMHKKAAPVRAAYLAYDAAKRTDDPLDEWRMASRRVRSNVAREWEQQRTSGRGLQGPDGRVVVSAAELAGTKSVEDYIVLVDRAMRRAAEEEARRDPALAALMRGADSRPAPRESDVLAIMDGRDTAIVTVKRTARLPGGGETAFEEEHRFIAEEGVWRHDCDDD